MFGAAAFAKLHDVPVEMDRRKQGGVKTGQQDGTHFCTSCWKL